jgi:hypothetical protein
VDDEDDSGLTPLHTAAEMGLIAMAELLLDKGADLNYAGEGLVLEVVCGCVGGCVGVWVGGGVGDGDGGGKVVGWGGGGCGWGGGMGGQGGWVGGGQHQC